VHERPADVHDSDVAAALAGQWGLTVQDLSYLPVGFGGYHWLAVDPTGSRWFVTSQRRQIRRMVPGLAGVMLTVSESSPVWATRRMASIRWSAARSDEQLRLRPRAGQEIRLLPDAVRPALVRSSMVRAKSPHLGRS